jgi:hypothetical protein
MHGDEDLPTGHHPVTGAHHHEDVSGGIVAAVLSVLARRSVVVHGGIVEARGADPRDLDSRAFRRQRRVDTESSAVGWWHLGANGAPNEGERATRWASGRRSSGRLPT